ncbi:MAG TPA: hypothetical protein VG318_07495 [Actinomycetota bacterium]|nr:hypothetical protein [Actinomycetota bacterium]
MLAVATTMLAPPAQLASATGTIASLCRAVANVVSPAVAAANECPVPIAGSVTGETGSIKKNPVTDLVDAYSGVSGVNWQHQLFSNLTSKPQACSHYRNNQVVANEKWLILTQTAYRADMTDAPFATGTYYIGVGTTDELGTLRTADAMFAPKGRSCASGGEVNASSGSITYMTVTDTLVEGTYDLWFGPDHVTGTFSAPHCTLCAPRPNTQTCLKA